VILTPPAYHRATPESHVILHAPQRRRPARAPAGLDPVEAVLSWPRDEPLAALVSGPGARWTVLARPTRAIAIEAGTPRLTPPSCGRGEVAPGRFAGGWIGFLTYEAGRALEARPAGGACAGPGALWHRVDGALVHDRTTGAWSVAGDLASLPDLSGAPGEARVGAIRSVEGADRYRSRVRRAIEYVRAGDIYQANVAHRLRAPFEGSARRLMAELMRESGAWYGAYVEWDGDATRRAVCSASPELFVDLDASTGRVVTRPMKGTAPAGGTLDGAKDHAELNMIVDLMRNDLGRVCRFGTVRVESARTIERHGVGAGALHQGVATVSGVLREGLGRDELVRAAFPAGSITGAPKIRAMEIIDELEGFGRGVFCGSAGWIGDDGSMTMSVAIRTASVSGAPGAGGLDEIVGGALVYPVGAGIVADSSPEAEWQETLSKAAVLRGAASRLGARA
jgi:para-aminobenzoate synthetase component 1